ncbi:MAG: PKD domain-containing protein, partial [Flavobacteriales bacterium]
MSKLRELGLFYPFLVIAIFLSGTAMGQCPQVFDFYGNPVDNPYWYSCSGGDFNFNLQSPDNWEAYTIDWGDGTAQSSGPSWTSPAAITHNYTAAVDTFIVTITETSSGCLIEGVVVMEEATSASIQIPVGGLTQACAPQELEFINSSTNTSETTVFTWDFGDGSPVETYDYTNLGATVAHTYEPNTVDCETEVSLTAENYCNTIQGGASTATFNPIRIWDVDQAAITASATVLCYPDTVVDLTNTTERNCLFQGNIYQRYEYWNFGDYWGQGTDSIIDWTPWPPTFPNTIAYPGVGTYNVMMLDSNFCGVDTANISIEIVPPPTADINSSESTICVGEPITFFQNSSGGANSYQWNFDDGNGWLPTGGGNITYIFNNPGTYNVCSAVSIQGSSAGCSDTICVPVDVLPSPVAIISTDNTSGCDALTVNYEDLSIDGIESTWTFDVDPFTFDGSNPPPVDYNSTGNYITTLVVEGLNGCLDSDQALINVFGSPQPDFIANNVCQGVPSSFIDVSIADPGDPITSWVWDFGDNENSFDQNPEHVYASTGDYDVTLTITTANCSASITIEISVEPAPIPNVSSNPTEGCSPLSVEFTNNTSGADNSLWLFGDNNGSNEDEPIHTFVNLTDQDTTFQVVYTGFTAFGCAASDTLEVLVYPGAQASFLDNTVPPSCAPFDAFFENTSTGASNYEWDFGDNTTSTETSPSHQYTNETGFLQNFTVELIAYATNGCHDTIQSNVTVYPTPNFEFDLVPDSGCAPLLVTMPFITGINEYQWDFGDGSDISPFPTPTHLFENQTNDPVIYDVTLIGVSPFGCADTTGSQVWVNPQPTAQFDVDINSGCSPLEVTFENLSLQADTYEWQYGGAGVSNDSNEFHSFTFENLSSSVIVYEVILTAISDDGCIDTFTIPIQVFPQAIASFVQPEEGCSPYTVTFENTSSDYQNLSWDFGNGLASVNENPSTTFVGPIGQDTTFMVGLMITTSLDCNAFIELPVLVHPAPTANFALSQDEGCHPAPADITNLSTGATSYEWDYGDDQFSNEDAAVHQHVWSSTSANAIDYLVSLTAISDFGCEDQSAIPYTVFPLVTAGVETVETGCSPLQVTFSNQSLGASDGFQWDFGDGIGSAQANPNHTFVNNSLADTTFNVTLIASSIYGCTDTLETPVTVLNTPIANALIDTTLGCYPVEVTFQNASIGADHVEWVYGTGETDDIEDEFHNYTYYNFGTEPVSYNITLNVTSSSGCTSSDQLSIDVLPELEANFESNESGCSPLTVEFENTSVGALQYQWFFGDGDTHTIANPSHVYSNPSTQDSTFQVMMIASSTFGCQDTVYTDIVVYATPEAEFT